LINVKRDRAFFHGLTTAFVYRLNCIQDGLQSGSHITRKVQSENAPLMIL
jgi:hypothetical protein